MLDAACAFRQALSISNIFIRRFRMELVYAGVFAAVTLHDCKHINLAIASRPAGTSCPCNIIQCYKFQWHAPVRPWLARWLSIAGMQPTSPALQLQ